MAAPGEHRRLDARGEGAARSRRTRSERGEGTNADAMGERERGARTSEVVGAAGNVRLGRRGRGAIGAVWKAWRSWIASGSESDEREPQSGSVGDGGGTVGTSSGAGAWSFSASVGERKGCGEEVERRGERDQVGREAELRVSLVNSTVRRQGRAPPALRVRPEERAAPVHLDPSGKGANVGIDGEGRIALHAEDHRSASQAPNVVGLRADGLGALADQRDVLKHRMALLEG